MLLHIYALGGGLGHLNRALALGRAAGRRGHRSRIWTNSPFAGALFGADGFARLPDGCALEFVPPELNRGQVAERIHKDFAQPDCDAVLVDVFPRGLGGELAELLPGWHVPKVLIHRELSPAYVQSFEVASWVARYDLILDAGDGGTFADHPRAAKTGPWLIRDADELLTPAAAREALGLSPGRRAILVLGCGRPEELEVAGALTGRLAEGFRAEADVCFAAPVPVSGLVERGARTLLRWPLLELLRGVDLLVGAGGYNTVHEARSAGVPLLAVPRRRTYDRQDRRLRDAERLDEADPVSCVRERLASAPPARSRAEPNYRNGVHAALDALERLKG
ncbi:MAG: hypothetical protein M5U26_24295 [Planctomycetota bacterium]|nr:hypothetical protein [Planctomycetota bacterium]